MGIATVSNFAGFPHDTTFQYDNRRVMININSNHQLKLSQAIAYTNHLQSAAGPTADVLALWTKVLFDVWRRDHYSAWVTQRAASTSVAIPAANPYVT